MVGNRSERKQKGKSTANKKGKDSTVDEPPDQTDQRAIVKEHVDPGDKSVKEEERKGSTASETTVKPESPCTSGEKIQKKSEKWKVGEKILCFHGPLIYEAKIQAVEIQNGIPKYFIHYHGWNKNWDEWVPEARMLKFTEKNSVIQKDLSRAHEEKNNEKRRRGLKRKNDESEGEDRSEHVFAVPKPPSPISRPRRKAGLRPQKREVKKYTVDDEDEEAVKKIAEILKPPDNTVESREIYQSKMEIRIKIPDELKSYIVDDWEQITRHKTVCVLPARLTVDQLLENYKRAKTSNKNEAANRNNRLKAIVEVIAGLREYFNLMLPVQLLYKQERTQYEKLKESDPSMLPISVYGAPHLLRLLTKLGETLVYTPLAERSINLLLFYLHDILNYIKRNSSLIFSNSDYHSPTEGTQSPESSEPKPN